MWITWSNDSTSYSPTHIGIQSWQASPAKSIEKKPHMAFVKVVGGSEIYNFRIQSFVHLYSKNWSFSISNTCTLSRCRPERSHAPSASAPEATAGRGNPPSQATHLPLAVATPQDASIAPRHAPPRRRVVRAPRTRRTTGPSAVRPYAHWPRSVVAQRHLGPRHLAVTTGRARVL
jgi:hypothetical protein